MSFVYMGFFTCFWIANIFGNTYATENTVRIQRIYIGAYVWTQEENHTSLEEQYHSRFAQSTKRLLTDGYLETVVVKCTTKKGNFFLRGFIHVQFSLQSCVAALTSLGVDHTCCYFSNSRFSSAVFIL